MLCRRSSHCHRPGGGGGSSGLKFLYWETEPAQFGVCKVPAAAGPGTGGHAFDILPGHPEQSIVVHRMGSTDPEIKMPELPSLLADDFGVELISEWIAAMPEQDCGGWRSGRVKAGGLACGGWCSGRVKAGGLACGG